MAENDSSAPSEPPKPEPRPIPDGRTEPERRDGDPSDTKEQR